MMMDSQILVRSLASSISLASDVHEIVAVPSIPFKWHTVRRERCTYSIDQ